MNGFLVAKQKADNLCASLRVRLLHLNQELVFLVPEDIYWVNSATLDFAKFLAHRINGTKCMFIFTYRHDEIVKKYLMENVTGDPA
jgi:hypothetical protein